MNDPTQLPQTTPPLGASDSDAERQDRDDLLALAQRHLGGLDRLMTRFKRRIFRYIFSRVNDLQTSEDLTQDVMMRLCREGYDGTVAASTWIFTVARHRMVDYLRSEGRRPRASRFPEDFALPERVASNPWQNLSREDEEARIRRWLSELPEEQAEAIRLRILGELSFAEAAEVLDCSVSTCKSRLRYGLVKLKALIQKENQT